MPKNKPKSIYLRGREFRAIPGRLGYYVSARGGVVSNKLFADRHYYHLKPQTNPKNKHLYVTTGIRGKSKTLQVHHAVLLAWVGPRIAGMCGLHKDDNPANNNPRNLYWGTYQQNAADRKRNGKTAYGERSGTSRFKNEFILTLRADAKRMSFRRLAKKYKQYPRPTIYDIVRGKVWKHIPGAVAKKTRRFWSVGQRNPAAKLSKQTILQLRQSALSHTTIKKIHQHHPQFSYSTIWMAVRGRTWSHLPGAVRSEWAQEHWRLKKKPRLTVKHTRVATANDTWQTL